MRSFFRKLSVNYLITSSSLLFMARRFRRRKKTFFDRLDRSQYRSCSPRCPYFGRCGGCSFQDIVYDDQIRIKQEYLSELFQRDVLVRPAPQAFAYRNRMDFVYAYGKFGLRKKGDFNTIIDIDSCALVPDQFQELYAYIKSELQSRNIESYNLESKGGFLRYVTFRFAPTTGEVMVFFSTTSPRSPDEELVFEEFLQDVSSRSTSVYWQINDSITDTSILPHEPRKVLGSPFITERLGSLSFRISPWSFFQNNSLMSEVVFQKIKDVVGGETVDCCCGVGSIGLFVADKVSMLTGLDSVPDAIHLAKENQELNGVSNARFFADDMKNLRDYVPLDIDTLIVDPPRAGLGAKTIRRLLSFSSKKIIYMSCNAKTQKMDFDLLLADDVYRLVSLEGFDMFPQTPHVETLALLERREIVDGVRGVSTQE